MPSDPWRALVQTFEATPMPGPLNGLRVGVKDLIAVKGVPRLLGAPELADPRPQPRDAICVARLRRAGAAIVATTATHPLAYGIVTPQTVNPRSPGRIAGGSSGGSAAALAAGLVDGALGSDTGGSVRIPAACCGVVGLKTTLGLVSVDGVQPLAPSLDTVGPMARDVATTARLLAALLERHPGACDPAPPPTLRIGVPLQARRSRLDAEVRSVWHTVLDAAASAGAQVIDVDLPALNDSSLANGRVLAAEAARTHARAFATSPQRFPADVRERLAAAHPLDSPPVQAARRVRAELSDQLARAFDRIDVLVTPTLPCRIPPVGVDPVVVDGHRERVISAMTRGTNSWNLVGVPAGSVPAGVDGDGGPVGMQVVGPWHGEATVLRAMALIEELCGGPWPPIAGSVS